MFQSKEEFQIEALKRLEQNNYTGCIVASTGSSKSKVAIDAIKKDQFKNILITSPRTNLKKSWKNELEKWGYNKGVHVETEYYFGRYSKDSVINVTLENIQTVYKWSKEQLLQFDLVIIDEIHAIGAEYFAFIYASRGLNIACIGLTATPDKTNEFKKEVLYKTLPILIEYHEAENDGLVNKVNYIVYEHELTNDYKVLTGTKDKKWWIGEKAQYDYLTEKYNKAKRLMFEQGASNYWEEALTWMKIGEGDKKKAGMEFFRAVTNRKNFLWNLTSTSELAMRIKKKILSNSTNKILIFSELTTQASKLSVNVIHSNVGDTAKQTQILNEETLRKFNSGEIRDIASVKSLTLGLNLIGANYAIFESYSGSDVQGTQKRGRLNRLKVDDFATMIVILVKNTQMETWYESAFPFIKDAKIIKSIDEL